jgi:septum formation inhibitor MinC
MTNSVNEGEGLQEAQGGSSGALNSATSVPGNPGAKKLEERSSVITARGTSEGLVLRIDGRVDQGDLLVAIREFLESRRSFLTGNDVAFEWVGQKPEDGVIQQVTQILGDEFSVSVRASKQKNPPPVATTAVKKPVEFSEPQPQPAAAKEGGPLALFGGGKAAQAKKGAERGISLFDGIESFDTKVGAVNPLSWDEPDARIIYGTLRSGQKVETEHSIVIFGDVNSGAEVIAGGDVVILGTLRGIAHAGAYEESGGGRVIFSLNLRPTQLRIGLVISRGSGSDDAESMPRGGLPEVARVDGNMIVVEPYQSRTVWVRRRE